jgi:hypothetical protein
MRTSLRILRFHFFFIHDSIFLGIMLASSGYIIMASFGFYTPNYE